MGQKNPVRSLFVGQITSSPISIIHDNIISIKLERKKPSAKENPPTFTKNVVQKSIENLST
jgi:hypothetical protein